MNRIFGFFREKLAEAKEENVNELQNLVTAFDVEPYSKAKMLANMQEIKTNYLEWTIMIANEASTGLYFAQLHNKNSALKKARALRENQGRLSKNQIVLQQMHKTIKELKAIDRLNKEWASDMNRKVQKLSGLISEQRQKYTEERQRMVRVNSKEQQEPSQTGQPSPQIPIPQNNSQQVALKPQQAVINKIVQQLLDQVQTVAQADIQ